MNDLNYHHKPVYRHKLNLLEPGIIMCKIICALIVPGALFWAIEWNKAAIVLFALAGLIFATLMVLVLVEAYQDNKLNEFFISLDEDSEENYGI